ncbi:hypothetical protein B0H11DRAFT_187614 [Mycena galericulata]|nr:hypothetical protein B0H11DRAFT_187614 [Mycena galericulata]
MEGLSARMEEIAAKVEALTARMDALSPSSPPTGSQRSPPSQMREEAPAIPSLFGSASKGFDFSNPSPNNQGGTSAAPKGFAFFDSPRSPPSQMREEAPAIPSLSGSASKGFDFPNPSPNNQGGTSAAPKGFAFFDSPRSPPSQMREEAPAIPSLSGSASKGFDFPNPSPNNQGGTSAAPKGFAFFDSPRSPPSQMREEAPAIPSLFGSASKGFDFLNPLAPKNQGGTSATPKEFPSFPTSAEDFGLPKQSSSTGEAPSQPQGTGDKSPAKASSESSCANPGTAIHSPIIGEPSSLGSSGKDSGSWRLEHDFQKSLTLGSDAVGVMSPVRTGSFHPRYAPYSLQDPEQASIINHYQSISCIPAYHGTSFEVFGTYHCS